MLREVVCPLVDAMAEPHDRTPEEEDKRKAATCASQLGIEKNEGGGRMEEEATGWDEWEGNWMGGKEMGGNEIGERGDCNLGEGSEWDATGQVVKGGEGSGGESGGGSG